MAAALLLCTVSCGEADAPTDKAETTSEIDTTTEKTVETDHGEPETEETTETVEPETEKTVETEPLPPTETDDIKNLSEIRALFPSTAEPVEYTVGEDRYDLDCAALLFRDTTEEDFDKFVSDMTDNGFVVYATNDDGINGLCRQATLYNKIFTVNAAIYTKTSETYITVEACGALSPLQIKPNEQMFGTNTVYHNPRHPNNAKGSYAFGECDIFQLSNDHFVIVDGAQEYSAPMLVEYLENLVGDGSTPIVDAWFFTHAHPDHIYCAWGIGRDENLVSRIKVNGFYYTWPNDEGMQQESDYSGLLRQVENFNSVIENFRGEDGNITPRYKIHAGMTFYIDEMKVEILLTQDQHMPSDYTGGFNDSSTSYKFTIYLQDGEETTFLIMGDAHRGVCTELMAKYDYETLHTEFFTSLHHGNNDILEFFVFIKPDYIIYTAPKNNQKNYLGYKWLENNSKGFFVAGDIIKLPYQYND